MSSAPDGLRPFRTPSLPGGLIERLRAQDPTRPRVTCYDDMPGATQGERVELSARVLDTWVAKAASLISQDWSAEPNVAVGLDLTAHWRVLYWAFAAWATGAAVDLNNLANNTHPSNWLRERPVPWVGLASDRPDRLQAFPDLERALVTRASLARHAHPASVPPILDEAAELAGWPDSFTCLTPPEPDDPALVVDEVISHRELRSWAAQQRPSGHPLEPGARLAVGTTSSRTLLAAAVGVFAVDGSLVLTLGQHTPHQRVLAEGATELW